MRRRQFIVGAGTAGGVGLAGCTGFVGGGDPSGTLTVATYSSFTGEGAAGNWLKSAFEEENPDTTVEFVTPENGLNQYVQRAQQDAPIDADLYVGLNTGELVRADERLDSALFTSVESGLEGASEVKESLRIDPNGRAITYDTGYITLVYDEDEVRGRSRSTPCWNPPSRTRSSRRTPSSQTPAGRSCSGPSPTAARTPTSTTGRGCWTTA